MTMRTMAMVALLAACGSADGEGEAGGSDTEPTSGDEVENVVGPMRGTFGLGMVSELGASPQAPPGYDEGRAMFDEGMSLHEAGQYAVAAGRFMEAAARFRQAIRGPHADAIRRNHRIACENAALDWLNAEQQAQAESVAATVESSDAECAEAMRGQLEQLGEP